MRAIGLAGADGHGHLEGFGRAVHHLVQEALGEAFGHQRAAQRAAIARPLPAQRVVGLVEQRLQHFRMQALVGMAGAEVDAQADHPRLITMAADQQRPAPGPSAADDNVERQGPGHRRHPLLRFRAGLADHLGARAELAAGIHQVDCPEGHQAGQ